MSTYSTLLHTVKVPVLEIGNYDLRMDPVPPRYVVRWTVAGRSRPDVKEFPYTDKGRQKAVECFLDLLAIRKEIDQKARDYVEQNISLGLAVRADAWREWMDVDAVPARTERRSLSSSA